MAIEVRKKEKETPQSLVQRFTKVIKQSGLLLELRRRQFYQRPKSDLAKKRSALRRLEIQRQRAKEEKMAKPI